MQLLFATFTVSERLLHALSWTLLHSLWQGALVAFLAGILFWGAANWNANLRYNILLGLLVLFVGIAGFTFWSEWDKIESNKHELPVSTNKFQAKIDFTASLNDPISTVSFDKKSNWVQLFERYKVLLLFIWALVLILKSIKMCLEIAYTYKVRTFKTKPTALIWSSRLQTLAEQLGVKQTILMLESEIIQGPATLGFFKPLILLPIGLINHLSVAQVEAILLHELAHIRRNDYLVNLLQCVLENIFFFNPALLWLSQRIREERENCCDDLAVQVLQDKQLYAQTLLRFQEYQWSERQYAQAFGGNKTPLLTRIKRILKQSDYQTLNVLEKISLLFGTFLMGVLMWWTAPETPIRTPISMSVARVFQPKQETKRHLSDQNIPSTRVERGPAKAEPLSVQSYGKTTTFEKMEFISEPYFNTVDTVPLDHARLAQLQMDLALVKRQYEQEQAKFDSLSALAEKKATELGEEINQKVAGERVKKVLEMLIADFIADGIIKDKKQLKSYRLDKNTFKVNGSKQTNELRRTYLRKYISNPVTGNHAVLLMPNRPLMIQPDGKIKPLPKWTKAPNQ